MNADLGLTTRWYIKDTTGTYDYALLLVAAALLCGGALGLYLGPVTARAKPAAS